MTYFFQEKKVSPHGRDIYQIFGHRPPNKEETARNKE
jgi:hypothetical protein